MPDAIPLHFDDYDHVTIGPESFEQWLADGPDYNAWRCDQLVADLERLNRGDAITHPVTGEPQGPATAVLFDAPLGRAHTATSAWIDTMIFLDTPLDIAMARRLLRGTSEDPTTSLAEEMRVYLEFGRKCYLMMDRIIKPTCDHVVDGSRTVDAIVDEIVRLFERPAGRDRRAGDR